MKRKKILALLLCALLAAAVITGCSDSTSDNGKTDDGEKDPGTADTAADDSEKNAETTDSGEKNDGEDDQNDADVDFSAYKAPAEVVKIDETAEDPSNDSIRFVYDDAGRIENCYYNIGDQQVALSYTYGDGTVQIYGFMGEFFVADEQIDLPGEYDPSVGFASVNGYYLKGYKF